VPRIDRRDSRVIVVKGDGEINEGSVWEAAVYAGKHKLSNLSAIVLQQDPGGRPDAGGAGSRAVAG
jgi:transketolase N-terminal domain/subunit